MGNAPVSIAGTLPQIPFTAKRHKERKRSAGLQPGVPIGKLAFQMPDNSQPRKATVLAGKLEIIIVADSLNGRLSSTG